LEKAELREAQRKAAAKARKAAEANKKKKPHKPRTTGRLQ